LAAWPTLHRLHPHPHATHVLPVCGCAPGLFAGAALFISTVEVPAAFQTGTAAFYAYFPHMYSR
jgi:hypothetical protein